MSEMRGFAKFLVAVLAPILLVFGGAGLAALGVSTGWYVLLWTGLVTGFQLGVPLVAIWVPGAVVSGVLARRGPRPGYCYCGYDLTGRGA